MAGDMPPKASAHVDRFETLQVHAGQTPDATTMARGVPIYQTYCFNFHSSAHAARLFALEQDGEIATRTGNPTIYVVEKRVAALEGGVAAVATSSGQAAVFMTIVALAGNGDNIVSTKHMYHGAYNQFSFLFPEFGVAAKKVDETPAAIEAAIDDRTRAIYIETVGHPKFNVPDIEAIAKVAHAKGVPLVVENTVGCAYFCQPIKHGADIVIHSLSKWLGGHGTSTGGIIVDSGNFKWKDNARFPNFNQPCAGYHDLNFLETFGRQAFIMRIRGQILRDVGSCLSPFNAQQFILGLETLSLRLDQTFQGQEAKILVRDCLDRPAEFFSAIERYNVSVVSTITWGRRISTLDDPVLKVAQAFVGSSSLALPGRCWTEAIPILADMPGFLNSLPAMMKQLADRSNKYFYALSAEGSQQNEDNFAKRLLREKEEHGLGDVDIANLTGNFIGAGVDTTSSAIMSCILSMGLFVDVQAKAHEELDRVVGRDRSPLWSDEPELHYIRALVHETLRWRPVFPLGGPQHCPTQDDEYEGFLIPKGVPILGNLYAINRNSREYPQPLEFRPERFLDGLERQYPNKIGHNVFGWGRRVCSGEPLAKQSLFYTMASLLWAFEIRPGLDENGNEVRLDCEAYNNMQVNRPLPFKARFIPRSDQIVQIIQE